MAMIRMIRIYTVFFFALILLMGGAAHAYHFPWDQGHDTTNWIEPPDPGTCSESTCDPCKSTGSPVYIPTGHFIWSDTDVALKGRPSLLVKRTYNSQDTRDGLFGNGWSVSFDIALYLATEAAGAKEYILRVANGKRYVFLVEADGSVTPPPGRFETVLPQEDGSVHLVFRDDSKIIFGRDGKPLSSLDKNGNAITYTYDATDQLIELSDDNGRSLEFAYSGCGRISHITDHASRTWAYDYDLDGNLVKVTDPMDGVRQYDYMAYQAAGDGHTYQYLTKVTDPSGVVVTQVVYSNGKVQSYTEGQNRYTYAYNTSLKQTTKTDLLGSRWSFSYNDQGVITKLVNPLNYQTNFGYDSNGLLIQTTDSLGKVWSSTYDSLGRILSSSNPLNETKTFEYTNSNARPSKLTTPNGRVYSFAYDSHGNLTSVTDPVGAQGRYAWGPRGDLIALTDALGNEQTLISSPDGLPLSITDALGRTGSYRYDNLGNVMQTTNPSGKVTSFSYDGLGRVSSIINPLGAVTCFSYDAAGRLTGVTDPNGGVTAYAYDAYGRLIEKTYPDSRKQNYTYRMDNLLNSATNPKRQTSSYSYDAAKRLTQENVAGQITIYTYSVRNELTSASNSSGTVSALYDAAGRIIQETNNGKTIQYTYNADGQRLSVTALGTSRSYAYGSRGLLASITGPSGVFDFTYDLMGRPTELQYPNNDVASYQYDAASQLSGINTNGTVNSNYGYERDAVGRIIRWSGEGSSDWYYQYDAAGRLIRADHGSESFAYTYDALGNILDNGRTHDIANRLVQDKDYAYTYDLNGNLTQKQDKISGARTVYNWNARNQLTHVERYADATSTLPNKLLTFTYDPLGRRMSKTEDGVTERYVYDYTDLIGVLDGSGNLLASYTFGLGSDEPLSMTGGGNTYYFHGNHQGSIMALNTDFQQVSQYGYDPYGKTQVTGETLNRFHYTAREQDADDLYYYRARYYDPTTYRFLSEDPIGFAGGLNVYAYVWNDPVNWVDPYGLWGLPTFTPVGTIARELHYNRNALNQDFENESDARENWGEPLLKWQSTTHQIGPGNEGNVKYVSPDGHSEAVYNNGKLVIDPVNRGTFNVFGPEYAVRHGIFDVVPWLLWGNSWDDPTSPLDRFNTLLNGLEAKREANGCKE